MSILIEKRGRRIVVQSDGPMPGLRTTVPGAYETTKGYWTVPLSLESCKLLRQKFGKKLRLGPELRRWAQGVVDSRKSMAKLAASEDAELEHLADLAPKLFEAMSKRTYQRVGVKFIADNPATLLADDPGLGKTLIAMGGILEAGATGPFLIVAPKTASDSVWRREILRWLPRGHRAITMPEHRPQRERKLLLTRYTNKTWVIVHPEMVMVQAWFVCHKCGKRTTETTKQQRMLDCGHPKERRTEKVVEAAYPKLFDIQWGAIVVDESHESLIRRTGSKTQRRRGLDLLRDMQGTDGIRLAMSGTPFDSKPHQLWGTLNWLDPVTYSAFHRWAELFWQKGGYTGFDIGEFRKDREPLLWDSLSAIALRRTKGEVAKDMPPKVYVGAPLWTEGDPTAEVDDPPTGIWLPMESKQAKAYEEIETQSVTELESGTLETISALSELTRLKQLACAYGRMEKRDVRVRCSVMMRKFPMAYQEECRDCQRRGWHVEPKDFYIPELPSNKFNWIIEALEEWGYPKDPIDKVVIVSFYTGILNMMGRGINEHFSTRRKPADLCVAITGQTKSADRRGIIDRFNERGGPRIMLLNVKAGGTAITIDSADRMIFISETRIPDQQKQAEDRIHRISNPRTCLYYYLRSLGTVDVGTAVLNQEMIKDTHRLLDERRGIDYVRQVLDLSKIRPQ